MAAIRSAGLRPRLVLKLARKRYPTLGHHAASSVRSGEEDTVAAAKRMVEAGALRDVDRKAKRRAIASLLIAGALLWIPVARLLLGQPPGFLRDLGFFSGPGGTAFGWALALAVAFAYAAFTVRNIPLVRRYWRALAAVKLLAVGVAFPAAIVEEAFFRRLVMDSLLANGSGPAIQVLASGLVFGAAHGVWGIVTGRIVAGVGAMVATGTVGIALAVVYVVGERSLAPPIVSHFLITATIQPGIMFAAFSGQLPRPTAGWWRPTL